MNNFECKNCGCSFSLNKDDMALLEDGEIMEPELCTECIDILNSNLFDEDCQRTDADNGL